MKDRVDIINTPGIIHIKKVNSASGIPPRLYPIKVRVCVEVAPGRI